MVITTGYILAKFIQLKKKKKKKTLQSLKRNRLLGEALEKINNLRWDENDDKRWPKHKRWAQEIKRLKPKEKDKISEDGLQFAMFLEVNPS